MSKLSEIIQTPEGRFSSKRVCGILGWAVILFSYIYLLVTRQAEPEFTDPLLWAVVTLLGVDSITYAFHRGDKVTTVSKNKDDENNGSEVREQEVHTRHRRDQ